MKNIIFLIIMVMFMCCNTSKSISKTKSNVDNSKVIIIYKKTACMGRCPVFTMTINGNSKTVTYVGQYNVTKIGTYSKLISNDSITKIVASFENAHFFDMEDKNMSNIPDLPSTIISYSINEKTKTIEESVIKPDKLSDLEKLLDTIANSDGWKKEETIPTK